MIKIVQAKLAGDHRISLRFSDDTEGLFDATELLQRQGSLLEPLRVPDYFARFFLELGALCWPNGLELSPASLHSELKSHNLLRPIRAVA